MINTVAECLLIADDLTGAVDASAPAVRENWRVSLNTSMGVSGPPQSGADEIVVNTDTRHCSPEEAARQVGAVLGSFGERLPRMIYKKTDSALRGNIAAELYAVWSRCPERPLFYVPAMPESGRTVMQSVLYVDGVPVGETAFADDPESPVRLSSIMELLRPAFGDNLRSMSLESVRAGDFADAAAPGCVVFDGETPDDLESIVQWMIQIQGPLLMAGPGGFSKYLPRLAGRESPSPELAWSPAPVLVSGSMHPRSQEQLAEALQLNAVEIVVALEESAPVDRQLLRSALEAGRRIVLHTGVRRELTASQHRELGRELASVAAGIIRAMDYPDCLVFGGQTSTDLVHTLGLQVAEVLGSPYPGMGILRFDEEESARAFVLTTKSGGMGPRPSELFHPADRKPPPRHR